MGLSRAEISERYSGLARPLITTWIGALVIYAAQFLMCGSTWAFPDDVVAFRVYNGLNKFSELAPVSQFTLEGVLPCKLGGLIATKGLSVPEVAFRYQVAVVLILLVVLSYGIIARKASAVVALGILAATSIPKYNLAWIMKPDMLLFSFLLLGVWLFDSPLAALALMAAGLCHPSQALVGALAMTGVHFVIRNRTPMSNLRELRIPPLWALAGGIAGQILNGWYQHKNFPTAMTRQMYAQKNRADIIVNGIPFTGEFLLLQAAAPLLVGIAIWVAGRAQPLPRWGRLGIALYVVAATALGLYFTYDHSRVAGIALMPGIAVLITHYRTEFETAFRRYPVAMIVGGLLLMALPELDLNGFRQFSFEGTGEAMDALRRQLRDLLNSHP